MNLEKTKNILLFKWVLFLAIFLAVLFVYRGALQLNFVNWDDPFFVTKNSMIQSLDWNNLVRMVTEFHFASWHPLTWFSHALDYRWHELNPWGHHLTNILLHGMNTCLVFLLFTTLIGKVYRDRFSSASIWVSAGTVALIFGLHPLRVESVAWVSERKDLLCGFFFLSTLLSYFCYATAESSRTRRYTYILTVLFFVLALMSKPMAVTVPLVLILLDFYPLNRIEDREKRLGLILEKLPFFVLSGISATLTLMAGKAGGAIKSFQEFGLGDRFISAIRNLIFYLQQTLWPSKLVPFYPFPKNISLTDGSVVVSALLILAITGLCVWMWGKRQKFWLAAWLYYLITISPVIGILHHGFHGAADRYTYLPTLSVYFLIGAGMLWLWENNSSIFYRNGVKGVSLMVSFAVITGLSLLTVQQIKVWKNGETFWKYVIENSSNPISMFHVGLGDFYREEGLLSKAELEFKRALQINTEDYTANYNLGLVYSERKETKKAEEQFKTTIKLDPENFEAHNRLGLIYAGRGKIEKAENEFKSALEYKPDYVQAFNHLGLIYLEKGQLAKAERKFKKVLKIRPKHVEAHNNLGLVYQEMGLPKKAIDRFEEALRIDPGFVDAHNNLGMTYFTEGQVEEAENQYKKAIEIDPGLEAARFNLAQLYRAQERWEEAEASYKTVLNLNPVHHLARQNLGVLYFDGNRLNEAERELVRVVEDHPGRADPHFFLAVVYAEMARFDEAEREFKAALKIDSSNAEFHNQLGILYGKTGSLEKAEVQFETALAIHPELASARSNLKKVQELSGGKQ